MDACHYIMKDFRKFNIDETNSDSPLLIHHILSKINPMTRTGISNAKINLGEIKLKGFDNDASLANEWVKRWME